MDISPGSGSVASSPCSAFGGSLPICNSVPGCTSGTCTDCRCVVRLMWLEKLWIQG